MNLVTGATGILGSHVLLTLLQNNEQVVAMRQRNSDVKKVEQLFSFYTTLYQELYNKIKWVEADVCDIFSLEEALEGITHVYHCAALVSFHKRDRKKLTEINETGTRNLVNACLNRQGIALCHVSSVATINNLDHKLKLDETVYWKTSGSESDYAISKYNAEREVWRGMEEGLKALIVNPGVILSPGFRTQSSGRLLEAGSKGHHFFTDGKAAYIGARDAAQCMVQLLSKNLFGNRYVLIENNYEYNEIFSWINSGFGHSVPFMRLGKRTLQVAAWLEGAFKLLSGKERKLSAALINAAFSKQEYSNSKVKEVLNYHFTPIREVIEEVCGKKGTGS